MISLPIRRDNSPYPPPFTAAMAGSSSAVIVNSAPGVAQK
jgi:hypothetical protein